MNDARENWLNKLFDSRFRKKFHLTEKDKDYIANTGFSNIKRHAFGFVTKRLAPAEPKNDGKQTPFKGHPIFIAQHATATCCRDCLKKSHGIEKHSELTEDQIQYVVDVICKWLIEENKL